MSMLLNGLKALLFTIYGLWVWCVFIVCCLAVIVLLIILPSVHARRVVVQYGAKLALRLSALRPRVARRNLLPAEPCVVVANHASYFDGVVMTALLPPRFQYVVKQEMAGVPVAGYLLKRIGAQFVRRTHAATTAGDARRIMKAAQNQESIVFFPEGTFAPEPGLKKFHNGAFIAAAAGGMPVKPVVIHGTRQVMPSGKWLARPGTISVLLKPAHRIGKDAKDALELKALCRQSILADLNEPDKLET